jgi:hypothetical protein
MYLHPRNAEQSLPTLHAVYDVRKCEKAVELRMYPTQYDATKHICHTVPIIVWNYTVLLRTGLPLSEASRKHELPDKPF